VLGIQRVRPGAEVIARPVGSPAAQQDTPPQPRAEPSRGSLNPVGSANAAESR
jgi:membrane fusion protein, multidrug efflux system